MRPLLFFVTTVCKDSTNIDTVCCLSAVLPTQLAEGGCWYYATLSILSVSRAHCPWCGLSIVSVFLLYILTYYYTFMQYIIFPAIFWLKCYCRTYIYVYTLNRLLQHTYTNMVAEPCCQ